MYKTRTKLLFSIIGIILVLIPSGILATDLSSSIAFSIPLGDLAKYNSPSPSICLEIFPMVNTNIKTGFSVGISSFAGKLNNNYTLQVLSPGISTEYYPLFFIRNRTIFAKIIFSYDIIEKRLHNVVEEGKDYSISNLFGGKCSIGNNWKLLIYLGDKHFAGGVDMLILGTALELHK